ncbi:cupin domain-containing protein [Variovorax ginsengisoli]|uniref:Cupin domain-containing protein n=1 Tax=Variovorax ginsengisoli TaxID=363844 RepID=A0ABT8SJD6_9BURK|nr:cupin domain-containing protein [Variovorax ginsengisoli]MDN8618496.1 cupin domain-containing protein [Variovorax ginsengisoli]MDO1537666.1 cupin domain-containing protein [Variovorax ginsengisoli]
MSDTERSLPRTEGYFSVRDDLPVERLAAVEGVKPKGIVEIRRLMVGEEILMLHVFREKGLVDPVHKHLDHETVAYLIKGRLRLVIGDQEFIAEAGTSWIHPRGVEHFSEALEDCEQLEIKSPPKKTWVSE